MKRFKLQCGTVIKVDDCDAYLLRSYVWRSHTRTDGKPEIVRGHMGVSRHKNNFGHYITGATGDQVVCFINGDTTDLRRENLKVMSRDEFKLEFGRHMASFSPMNKPRSKMEAA